MTFHSLNYAFFLVIVVAAFWAVAPWRLVRLPLLLVASYFFYSRWEFWFLGLIVFSTFLDYGCGQWIHTAKTKRGRKLGLLASLGGNLAVLGYFKYTGWAADSLRALFGVSEGLDWVWEGVVPVGISFYTFQTLSYTIDIYRGVLKPARNFGEFALFVSFFPQLVAGPIVRARDFLPQLELLPRFNRERLHDGLWRIGQGLVKKILLADVIGLYLVDPVYAAPEQYTPLMHLLALYGFAFQIYGDFSGYSDIAIGSARILGFDIPENFLAPFQSRSVREFWRRWHVSLSFWVRDYVYIPMGGSRGSEWKVSRNLVLTMLIIALWHGASVIWVLYGLLQGGAMVLERRLEAYRGGPFGTTKIRRAISWLVAWHFVAFTLAFVRADSLDQLVGVFVRFGDTFAVSPWALTALAFAAATHYLPQSIETPIVRGLKALPTPVAALLFGTACGSVAFALARDTPFIYFQF